MTRRPGVGAATDDQVGHASIRTLGKYARPGTETLAKWQQQTDRARRGRD